MARRGFFLALEGIDGAGTTTQLGPVAEHLRARGREVVTTCEPSDGDVGKLLRQLLRTGHVGDADEASVALLFAADRLAHLQAHVLPALKRGAVVVCDRYLWSSYAYQSTAARPLPLAWLRAINARAPAPDCIAWLAVSLASAARRRAARGGPTEAFDRADRQARVAACYAQLFAEANSAGPGAPLRLDAEASASEVTRVLCAALDAKLAEREQA